MKSIFEEFFKDKVDCYQLIKSDQVVYDLNFIKSCEMNHCGKYNQNWMCPPAINQTKIIEELKKYNHVFVISKVFKLEDPFDISGMNNGRIIFEKMIIQLKNLLNNQDDYQVFGAGSCTICEKCSYPNVPCKYPNLATIPLEAIGINVICLAKEAKMKYYHGINTVTYFAAIYF